jgi:hypothetical protein
MTNLHFLWQTKRFWIVLYGKVSYKGKMVHSGFSITENLEESNPATNIFGKRPSSGILITLLVFFNHLQKW